MRRTRTGDGFLPLYAAIAAFVIILTAACLIKYARFQYNGIDLAYFNQVFWNTVHGRPFVQSIHPHLSLGDHAELAILLLAPLYALMPDPRTLLVLQAVALALTAVPLSLFVRARLETLGTGPEGRYFKTFAPLLFALLWLASPLVHDIALFEFHILAFAPLPLMTALLMYERGRKLPFLASLLVALLVREDVALVVAAFGLLAWMERKTLWWRIVPLALGAGWFLAAMRLIAHFSPAANYKFAIYYAWLGGSPAEMAVNAVLHPLRVLGRVFQYRNAEMTIGLLLPFAFMPLRTPRRLLLAIGPFAQLALGASGGGSLAVQTHYSSLFLPGLFAAAVDALPAMSGLFARTRGWFGQHEARVAATLLLIIAGAYSALVIGPLPSMPSMAADRTLAARAGMARELVASVPANAAVAASYGLLPHFSSRERLTSLHYVFLGVTQFGERPYDMPEDARFVALDLEDFLAYRSQFPDVPWSATRYDGGYARIAGAAGAPIYHKGPYVLYDRAGAATGAAPRMNNASGGDDRARLVAVGSSVGRDLVAASEWKFADGPGSYALRMAIVSSGGRIELDLLLPVRAIPPATVETASGTILITSVLSLEGLAPGSYHGELRLERTPYILALAGTRATEMVPRGERAAVATVVLPEFAVGADGAVR